jgi:hypothetical protein
MSAFIRDSSIGNFHKICQNKGICSIGECLNRYRRHAWTYHWLIKDIIIGSQEHYQKIGKKLAAVSTFIRDGRVYDFHKHTQNWAHTAEWECMKRCRRKVSTCTA